MVCTSHHTLPGMELEVQQYPTPSTHSHAGGTGGLAITRLRLFIGSFFNGTE
jgi:hypothetical protein